MLESAFGLADAQGDGTGGDEVACLPAVGAENGVCPKVALFSRERAAGTVGTVWLHGTGSGGMGLGWGQSLGPGREGAGGLALLLGCAVK